jgi:hypothetical protein
MTSQELAEKLIDRVTSITDAIKIAAATEAIRIYKGKASQEEINEVFEGVKKIAEELTNINTSIVASMVIDGELSEEDQEKLIDESYKLGEEF